MSFSTAAAAPAAAAAATRSTRTKRRNNDDDNINIVSLPDDDENNNNNNNAVVLEMTTIPLKKKMKSTLIPTSLSIPDDCCSLGLQRIINDNEACHANGQQKQEKEQEQEQKFGPLIILYKNMYLGRTPLKMMQKMKLMNCEEIQNFNSLNKKFGKTQAPLGINWEKAGSSSSSSSSKDNKGLGLNNKTNNGSTTYLNKSKGGNSTEEHVSRHLLQIIDHCSSSSNTNTNNDNSNATSTSTITLTLQRCSEDATLKKQKKVQPNAKPRIPDVKIISTIVNDDNNNDSCTNTSTSSTKNIGPNQKVIVKEGDELFILNEQYRYKFVRVHAAVAAAAAAAVAVSTTVTTPQHKMKAEEEMKQNNNDNDDNVNANANANAKEGSRTTPPLLLRHSTVTSVGTNCSTRSTRSRKSISSVNDQTVVMNHTPMDVDVDDDVDDDVDEDNNDNDNDNDNNMIETVITEEEIEEDAEETKVQHRPAFLSFWDHSSRRSKSTSVAANTNANTDTDSKRIIISPDATTTTTCTATGSKTVVTAATITYTSNGNDDIDTKELQLQLQLQLQKQLSSSPSSRDMPISLANIYWKALNSSRPREGAWYLNTMISPLINNTVPSISICIEWMKLLTWGPQTSNGTAIAKINNKPDNSSNNRRRSSSSTSTTTSSSTFFWDGPRLHHAMTVWKKALRLHPTILLPRMIDSAPGGPTEWWKTVLCFDDIMEDENEIVDKRDNVNYKDNYLYSIPVPATVACDDKYGGDDNNNNDNDDVEFEKGIDILRMRSCRLDALIYLLESNMAFEERNNKEQKQQHEEKMKIQRAASITTDEEEKKNEDEKVEEKLAQSDSDSGSGSDSDSDSNDEMKKDETKKKSSSSLSTSSSRYSCLTILREIRIFGAKAALRVVAQAMARLWVSQRYYLGYYDDDVTDEEMKKRSSSVTINSLLGSNRYSLWQERTEVVEELVSQLAQMLKLIRSIVATNNNEEVAASTSNRRSRRHVESSSDLTERDLKGILWNAMDMQIQKSIPKTKRKKKGLKRTTKDDEDEEEIGPNEQLLVDWLYSLRTSLGDDFVEDLSEHVGVSEEYGDVMEM